ncbi:kinetochore protein Nuf2 [Sarcophilus harrisii]|uniref:kinetochore protein Nuf2 n=1 Tax=Sarcophilus harrisii TaxID=9305 RepID=UPI000273A35B|nr:kinetochore protein Nuf2 [Sarcophilus harrisii]XP_023354161.1 kinetochore protein Nuf2 [Sarcophilus harrisii]XP_031807063.1 kinetochore protein Nuf2 [Sarcophilus harrisii]XP_031807069.1 kinetochore protein Nuf2 [Sarcophilus harrisii]
METLSFPRLSPAEIVTHVQNSILTGADGKTLSKNDIFPNPKPEVLRKIFLRTLQIVYGIPLDACYMMPVNVEVMYPQIMEGFLPLCNLFVYMESFLRICRVNDFEFADIFYPKGKRTCRFLSAIINFIHFRESRREIYMKHLWEYKSSMDKMQQLHVAQQEALMKLEKLDSIPAEEQAEFKQLVEDIQERQQTLNGFRQKTTTIQDGISQKKLDVAEITKRLNELKLSLVTLKEEQENLKTKIVDSPEKLKNDKEKMKETVQKLKISKLEVTEKYEAYRDAIEGLPSFQMELQLYHKKIQELAESMDKVTRILKENQSLEDQIESSQTELKKQKTEETSLKRLVIVEKEKLATTQLKINKKHEDVKQYKRLVLEECNKIQEKRGAICDQVTTINCDVQKIRHEIQQLKDVTENEKVKFQEIFLTLKSALEKYHEAMEKAAEEGKARLSEKDAELKIELSI